MELVPVPMNAKALEYPEDDTEVLTILLIDEVPDPIKPRELTLPVTKALPETYNRVP
jgi:hypothetical protein